MAYKQHFIEWFSGKQLPAYWTEKNHTGTGAFAMVNEVDGGFSVKTGATSTNNSSINFANKRQYAYDGSVIIAAWKRVSASMIGAFGGINDATVSTNPTIEYARLSNDSALTYILIHSADATTASLTYSDIPKDQAWHIGKMEFSSSDIKGTIDGVLKITKTTNRPTVKLQPYVFSYSRAAAVGETRVRYMEAYNT